jgi:hypothetical protein
MLSLALQDPDFRPIVSSIVSLYIRIIVNIHMLFRVSELTMHLIYTELIM